MPRKVEETIILREGSYIVKRDSYNFILYRITKRRSGKDAGMEIEEVLGYHGSLAQVMQKMSDDMLDRKLKNNKDKTIEGVVKILDKHMKEINKKFGTEIKHD